MRYDCDNNKQHQADCRRYDWVICRGTDTGIAIEPQGTITDELLQRFKFKLQVREKSYRGRLAFEASTDNGKINTHIDEVKRIIAITISSEETLEFNVINHVYELVAELDGSIQRVLEGNIKIKPEVVRDENM